MECKEFLKIVDKPYPKIEGISKNPHYARLLLNPFAGMVSELTAINTYIYQHLIIDKKDECIAKTIEKISMAEMHHLELLGETIVALGGTPMYANRMGQAWSGQFVNYTKNLSRILIDNINAERQAIMDYEKLIMIIPVTQVQNLLMRIIEDEKSHIEAFENMLSYITLNNT